jgi:hypothetical protein
MGEIGTSKWWSARLGYVVSPYFRNAGWEDGLICWLSSNRRMAATTGAMPSQCETLIEVAMIRSAFGSSWTEDVTRCSPLVLILLRAPGFHLGPDAHTLVQTLQRCSPRLSHHAVIPWLRGLTSLDT